MTLEEARRDIDAVDTQMKPLFLKRMDCAKKIAEVKEQTGGDVFVLERELAIIEKRAGDVDPEVYDEYVAFLRHLMSVSRRYQYGRLKAMQDTVVDEALEKAGADPDRKHTRVDISFTCPLQTSDLNLFLNMAKLNKISVSAMTLESDNGLQLIRMTLEGCIQDENMRRLLCQIGKEADAFQILDLK